MTPPPLLLVGHGTRSDAGVAEFTRFVGQVHARTRGPAPALVIGLPVGFVGAVEAKQALRDSGLPAVTNISEKGGAAVAAAALNALVYGDPLEELDEDK